MIVACEFSQIVGVRKGDEPYSILPRQIFYTSAASQSRIHCRRGNGAGHAHPIERVQIQAQAFAEVDLDFEIAVNLPGYAGQYLE
jgi:hypothetical protein